MISEVANALFLTYVATEYIVWSERRLPSHSQRSISSFVSPGSAWTLVAVALINILDRLSGTAVAANHLFQRFLYLPKITFAASLYFTALYYDVRRLLPTISVASFARRVCLALIRVGPTYPILAVGISFLFMFAISAFEMLHLPLEWLNWPIYYGTLYGPFSVIYYSVKRHVADEYYALPSY